MVNTHGRSNGEDHGGCKKSTVLFATPLVDDLCTLCSQKDVCKSIRRSIKEKEGVIGLSKSKGIALQGV